MSHHFGTYVLKKLLFRRIGNILYYVDLTPNSWPNDRCSVSTVEPLHLFYMESFRKLKECTVSQFSSSELKTNLLLSKMHQKKSRSCENRLLNGRINLLGAYKNVFRVFGLQTDFSTQQMTSKLNDFFTTTDAEGVLEGKYFSALEVIFPFICAFPDRSTRYGWQHVLTQINTVYSDIVDNHFKSSSDMTMLRQKSFFVVGKLFTLK